MQARVFGVLGDPVDHSLSPAMHHAACAAAGLPHVYLRYRVPAALLPAAVREAKALRMGGLNLTVPLKEAVLPLLDAVTREAERIGAVNTILFAAGGRTVGDNTDGRGFLAALRGRVRLRGARALILGPGGPAPAVGAARACATLPRRGAACSWTWCTPRARRPSWPVPRAPAGRRSAAPTCCSTRARSPSRPGPAAARRAPSWPARCAPRDSRALCCRAPPPPPLAAPRRDAPPPR